MPVKCKVSGCKGYLTIQYRHSDLRPFIACSAWTDKHNPCGFTESLSAEEIELLNSETISEREVVEKHYNE